MTTYQGMLTNSGIKTALSPLSPLLDLLYLIMWGPAVVEVTWFPSGWRVASHSPCDWSILLKVHSVGATGSHKASPTFARLPVLVDMEDLPLRWRDWRLILFKSCEDLL